MNTKELNRTPDTKGSAGRSTAADQLVAAKVRENVSENETKKTVYLRPNSDAKIDDWFKYQKQQFARQFEIEMLESAVIAKYGGFFGINFCRSLFYDVLQFTNNFQSDIVTKIDDGDSCEDISYKKGDVTINRYLVTAENNVCSIFRHVLEYAVATGRESVRELIAKEERERDAKRAANTAKRREEREAEKVGKKINELSADKLLALLTPEQIAALIAAQNNAK